MTPVTATSPAIRSPEGSDFWAGPNVMSQKGYEQALASWGAPGGLQDFLKDWATKGEGRGIVNPDGTMASYAQVLQDLALNRGLDISGIPQQAYQGATATQRSALPADVANQFALQRSNANTNYQQLLAQLDQRQGELNMNEGRDLQRYGLQTTQQRGALPGSFVGRGVYGSGIWNHALGDWATGRAQGEGDIRNQYTNLLSQIDTSRSTGATQYNQQLAGVDANEQSAKAKLVADLKAQGLVS